MKMTDFRTRYKAYQNAEHPATSLSGILSLVVMFFLIAFIYYGIMSFTESIVLRIFLFLVAALIVCIIGAVIGYKLKRCFLRMFFKRELHKMK